MPPKLSPVQIDEKLENLHEFVRVHVGLLASRNGASLRACLRQTASAEERRLYKLLVKSEEEYTSPVSKIYKVESEYIIITENSIYVVSADIPTKRISGA